MVVTDSELPGCSGPGFVKETLSVLHLAWPLCISMLLDFLLKPASISFCGHLGTTELAAVCLAISVISILVTAVGQGLAFGGATFLAQAYGSDKKTNVGIYLQKGLIFTVLWSLPMIGILLNIEDVFLLMGQNPDVARLAQIYINYFLPGTWACAALMTIIRYLVCQNRIYPVMVASILAFAANLGLNYGLVTKAGFGLRGSAVAFSVTYYFELFLCLVYIISTSIYKETWAGWSLACMEKWGEFSSITSFSIALNVFYWLATEIGTYTAGMVSPTSLSAYSISFQMEFISSSLFVALGGVCGTRIGQFLGANKPKMAAFSAHVAISLSLVMAIILALLCFLLRDYIPQIFTQDKTLIDIVASVLQLTSIFLSLEGIGLTCLGVLRGIGWQAHGTVIIMVSWFLIAWPIGLPLMFCTKLGLYGLWISFIIGILFQDIFILILVWRINWNKQAHLAVKRAALKATTLLTEETQASKQVFSEKSNLLSSSYGTITKKSYVRSNLDFKLKEKQDISTFDSRKSKNKLILKRLFISMLFALPLVLGIIRRLTVVRDFHGASSVGNITLVDNTTYFNMNVIQNDITTTVLNKL